jgi:histidinol-phosphate aminotransferase
VTTRADGVRSVELLDSFVRWPEPGHEADGLVRLNRNERLAPLPAEFVKAIRDRLTSDLLTQYPVADDVYAALAAHTGLQRGQLLLTPGSDAAVKAAFHAFVERGDSVVMLDPSYAMYAVYSEMFGATAFKVPFERVEPVSADRVLAAIDDRVKLVLITNPNQPTGTLMADADLLEVVRAAASVGALVLVDEAYGDFARTTVIPHVDSYPNLVVTRTFSKAAGLAGLRIGYAAADPRVIDALFKVRSVHDVNAVAMLCAEEILAIPSVVDDYVDAVRAGAQTLHARAAALGLEVPETHTNFALVRVGEVVEPGVLVERLRERGYLVRGPFSAPALAPYIRVTLGPPEIIDGFCDVLAEVLHADGRG